MIQKEKEDDSALMQRAHNKVKKPGKIYVQKSNIVRKLYPSDCKRRIVTNISQSYEPHSLIERSSVSRSVLKNSSCKQ